MRILALEFSGKVRAVAVYDVESGTVPGKVCEEFGAKTAMELIAEALRAARLAPASIDLIAVGLGPGSNAGIRSAISIAQGWHFARGTPVVGIRKAEAESVEALASLAARTAPVAPEKLEPIYDREVSFVKAPPQRTY